MDLKGNLSTEHQRAGDAKRPDDTQDRLQTTEDENSERGRRAFIAGNGEVRGSGAGAGGGNQREDYDADPVSGGGDLAESPDTNDGQEDQIHQAVENQSTVSPDDYPEKNSGATPDKG